MPKYQESTTVQAQPAQLFAYLSDVRNLPRYFSRMTSAEPAEGQAVHVTADVDGREVEGEAWFRSDEARQRIEWGSEGPSRYSGFLDVSPDGDVSAVTVTVDTTHDDEGIRNGLRETLDSIRRQVEGA